MGSIVATQRTMIFTVAVRISFLSCHARLHALEQYRAGPLRIRCSLLPSIQRFRGSDPQVLQKLRCRLDPGYQQVIACACTGDVEQVALGVVHFFQVCFVSDGLDAFL